MQEFFHDRHTFALFGCAIGSHKMRCINLIDMFDREIEVLEVTDTAMIYAIDQKNEVMDACRIGRYDFETGINHSLMLLEYTRIYESFQTYRQMRDFFYAVNVLQDYRLRLRRINKTTWAPEGEILIEALGEILNIFIIDARYLLIVDEVKKTDEFLDMFNIEEDEGEYINVCYLYDCHSGQRYPLTDRRLHGMIDLVRVRTDTVVIAVHRSSDLDDESRVCQDARGAPASAVYRMDKGAFVRALTERMPLFLEDVCVADDHSGVRFLENDNDEIVCVVRDFRDGTEKIVLCGDSGGTRRVIRQYPYTANGTYFYDPWNYHVYVERDFAVEDMADAGKTHVEKRVDCLTDPGRSFCYDSRYGEFAGISRGGIFVTTFYREVMAKEDEYHEYVAVHEPEDGDVPLTREGRFVAWRDKLILLKSFLAL